MHAHTTTKIYLDVEDIIGLINREFPELDIAESDIIEVKTNRESINNRFVSMDILINTNSLTFKDIEDDFIISGEDYLEPRKYKNRR